MQRVIVTRAAYNQYVDKVIAYNGGSLHEVICEHYPGATNITTGDFDHPSADKGYLFDFATVEGM